MTSIDYKALFELEVQRSAAERARADAAERKYHKLLLRWSNLHDSILADRRAAEAES